MNRTYRHLLLVGMLAICAAPAWAPAQAKAPAPTDSRKPPLRVAYFVPTDRTPEPGYVERIDRVLTEVQRFYREGMAAAGYGPMTFALDRDGKGKLQIHVVKARQPMRAYGRSASGPVRREVKAALTAKGIDIDRETVVIFQLLLGWEGKKATEIGPYCGGGSHLAGTAWVYDDKLLDARNLPSKAAGGYYHRPVSIGRFNTHYIGGVAHELGHGFGLPHVCERKIDRGKGKALMGGGNHTYGQEKRGEGPGSFLSDVSAMFLSTTRPFAGEIDGARDRPSCGLADLKAAFEGGKLILSAKLTAKPAARGVSAYDDWAKIPGNYDAVGWTCKVGDDGRFRIEVGELRPGASQLRLVVSHANGAKTRFPFDYTVDEKGKPDLTAFRTPRR